MMCFALTIDRYAKTKIFAIEKSARLFLSSLTISEIAVVVVVVTGYKRRTTTEGLCRLKEYQYTSPHNKHTQINARTHAVAHNIEHNKTGITKQPKQK